MKTIGILEIRVGDSGHHGSIVQVWERDASTDDRGIGGTGYTIAAALRDAAQWLDERAVEAEDARVRARLTKRLEAEKE